MYFNLMINRYSYFIENDLSSAQRLLIVNKALDGGVICDGQVMALQTRRVSTPTGAVQLLYFAVTAAQGSGGINQLGFVPLIGEEIVRARLLLMNISNNT